MSNDNLFSVIGSETRIKIIRKLLNREIHISQLSRELNISKPVISRHIRILENAGLIQRRVIGNVHLLSASLKILENAFEPFIEETEIDIDKNITIFDILKQLPTIETKSHGKNQFITSINGEEGFYIYEVNGKTPKEAINEYEAKENITLDLKKLVPVSKKKIKINFKEKNEKEEEK